MFAKPSSVFFAVALLAAAVAARADEQVLAVARSFADGGGYNRSWSGSGTPEAVSHAGRKVLAASEGGTYCCGYTFAVAMRVAGERGLLADKSYDEVKRFQKLWYGATELDDQTLVTLAGETLGVGRAAPLSDARPGDFVQLWRTGGSGHSVVFLEWVSPKSDVEGATSREPIGFRYRSSQGSTDGIGDATEYFSDAVDPVSGKPGRVLRDKTYVCRLLVEPRE